MPEEKPPDAVEKLLTEQRSLEDRKQAPIADLLKQRETALKEFDDKLSKLGYSGNSAAKPKRSHHKKTSQASGEAAPKAKSKG